MLHADEPSGRGLLVERDVEREPDIAKPDPGGRLLPPPPRSVPRPVHGRVDLRRGMRVRVPAAADHRADRVAPPYDGSARTVKGRTIARGLHKGWLAADIIPLAKRSTDQEKVSVKDMACIQGVNASGNFLSAIMDMMWNHVNIVRER